MYKIIQKNKINIITTTVFQEMKKECFKIIMKWKCEWNFFSLIDAIARYCYRLIFEYVCKSISCVYILEFRWYEQISNWHIILAPQKCIYLPFWTCLPILTLVGFQFKLPQLLYKKDLCSRDKNYDMIEFSCKIERNKKKSSIDW